jgi:hypothetical protein
MVLLGYSIEAKLSHGRVVGVNNNAQNPLGHWLDGLRSGASLQIVGTSPSDQKKHEKPETNEGCTKQKPQGASSKLCEGEQNEYTPKARKQRTHFDPLIPTAGSDEQWYSEGERRNHERS